MIHRVMGRSMQREAVPLSFVNELFSQGLKEPKLCEEGSLCSHPPEYGAHPETTAPCSARKGCSARRAEHPQQATGWILFIRRLKKKIGGGAASSLNSLSPPMSESKALTGSVCSSGHPSGANFARHPKPCELTVVAEASWAAALV